MNHVRFEDGKYFLKTTMGEWTLIAPEPQYGKGHHVSVKGHGTVDGLFCVETFYVMVSEEARELLKDEKSDFEGSS